MTAKKSLGWENHQEAVRIHGRIERSCDPEIANGIISVHRLIDMHYAAGKAGMYLRTILPLVREHVDEPVKKWLMKLGVEPFSYGAMLEDREAYCAAFFERMAESFAEKDPSGYSYRYPDLDRTTDSLIEFCSYCLCHRANNTQILKIEMDERNKNIVHVHPKRGKESAGTVRRMEQLGINVEIDFTTMNDEHPYCQLCTDLTIHTREHMRLLFSRSSDGQISDDDRRKLAATDLRVVIPNYSRHYCAKHDPDDTPSTGYNRARGRRKIYYSMRRFMIIARHARQLSTPYWHIVRAAAYLIADECPDQSLIDKVPLLVDGWYTTWERPNERITTDDRIADHFDHIVQSFSVADHRMAEFVTALAFHKSEGVYDAAKACGAFPDEIEHLIDIGFLYCSRIQAFNLGAAFLMVEG